MNEYTKEIHGAICDEIERQLKENEDTAYMNDWIPMQKMEPRYMPHALQKVEAEVILEKIKSYYTAIKYNCDFIFYWSHNWHFRLMVSKKFTSLKELGK